MGERADVLLVQVTPSRDSFVPITRAAIDRRLDQIAANAVLNAEISALELSGHTDARLFRIAAEDGIDGLGQRSAADLGKGSVKLLHARGRDAAERWLRQTSAADLKSLQHEPQVLPRDFRSKAALES